MANRTYYHVKPTDSGWEGKKVGASRASVTGRTKAEVRDKTIAIAKNNKPSSVRIHKSDGTFEEERTYNGDPYPPSG